ncbi:hypothetical protein M9Y10_022681 [Tritrichomonas musculus]|uniref:Glycosyltransferase 61 catalytic domain-containing protein n=1 Tax=Tritrichomonas musculus TaxID=1915356 RepID=A0ABR2KTY3_9EUKA
MILFLVISCSSLINLSSAYPVKVSYNGYWRQYRICHPPFNWSLPRGLKPKYEELFWVQPENMRHFIDTNKSDHCAVVRLVRNGSVFLPYPNLSNVTHFINTKTAPKQAKKTDYQLLLIMTGHWGHYFQHFFDNIGPQLSVAIDVMGLDLKKINIVVDTSQLFPNVPKLWQRMGFKEVIFSKVNKNYTAENLVYIESTPRVHPHYFVNLRRFLKIPTNPPKKIIFISRKMSNSYYNQRFILNEDELIEMIFQIYGKNNVVIYDHHNYTLDETIQLFSQARAIIGAHGGGMYNQFFAPKSAVIIEIMPIKPNGLYPDQKSKDEIPSFSHMAVWSNSLLIGQTFYRYYQITYLSNFKIDLKKFEKFLSRVPELIDDEL